MAHVSQMQIQETPGNVTIVCIECVAVIGSYVTVQVDRNIHRLTRSKDPFSMWDTHTYKCVHASAYQHGTLTCM